LGRGLEMDDSKIKDSSGTAAKEKIKRNEIRLKINIEIIKKVKSCFPRQIASFLQCKHLCLNDLNKLKYIVSNILSFESFLHMFRPFRALLIHSFIMIFSRIDLTYLYFKFRSINNYLRENLLQRKTHDNKHTR